MYVRVFMVLAKKGKSYFSRSGKSLQNVLKIVFENLGKVKKFVFWLPIPFHCSN